MKSLKHVDSFGEGINKIRFVN